MIILDSNVLSELFKPLPLEKVLDWLSGQEPAAVYTTAITQAELLYGVQSIPPGRRQVRMAAAIERVLTEEFSGRILPFDSNAARLYADIVVSRNAVGRPISQPGAMIAAIARSHRATVATRNTSDFELCEIKLLNPWSV